MSYILVAEDEEDIRDIYDMILRRAFELDVVLVESGKKALEVIDEKGAPLLIISDYNMPEGDGDYLYQNLLEKNIHAPFIFCSTDSIDLKKKYPHIHGFVEKPRIIGPLLELVEKIVSRVKVPKSYVPVRISYLLRLGKVEFDLFMKLSESNFVKVINAQDFFIAEDAERFLGKGIEYLYVTSENADLYIEQFQNNIAKLISSEVITPQFTITSLETIEAVERIAKSLGWTPVVLHTAKQAVDLAIKAVSVEPNILRLFYEKFNNESKFSAHVGKLSLLTCGFCYQLGWTSESTQMKLGLASLMHDLTLNEKIYEEVFIWNEAACDPHDKSPEVTKYRGHPAEAASLLLTMKDIPADVDQIILQHHETSDGRGFPRGLITSRISPMACIFIVVEDLLNFIDEASDYSKKIEDFLDRREERYSSGHFKKVFAVLKESVSKLGQS